MPREDTQHLIGRTLPDEAGRDAIHIAVAPVIARERLYPGQHVGLRDGEATATGPMNTPLVGIVDPYLMHHVEQGDRFFVFLYPNTITSLAHHWTHPAFEQAPTRERPVITPRGPIPSAMVREELARSSDGVALQSMAHPVGVEHLRALTESARTEQEERAARVLNESFPDSPETTRRRAESETWLRDFCAGHDCPDYETVMMAIREQNHPPRGMAGEEYVNSRYDEEYLHFDGLDAHDSIPSEFWDHVAVVLGHPPRYRPSSFSCSC